MEALRLVPLPEEEAEELDRKVFSVEVEDFVLPVEGLKSAIERSFEGVVSQHDYLAGALEKAFQTVFRLDYLSREPSLSEVEVFERASSRFVCLVERDYVPESGDVIRGPLGVVRRLIAVFERAASVLRSFVSRSQSTPKVRVDALVLADSFDALQSRLRIRFDKFLVGLYQVIFELDYYRELRERWVCRNPQIFDPLAYAETLWIMQRISPGLREDPPLLALYVQRVEISWITKVCARKGRRGSAEALLSVYREDVARLAGSALLARRAFWLLKARWRLRADVFTIIEITADVVRRHPSFPELDKLWRESYNIDVETPTSMDRPGETSQDIAPQGPQPEFEQAQERAALRQALRANLKAALEAQEEANERVRLAEDKLTDTERKELGETFVSVQSKAFARHSSKVRAFLEASKTVLVSVDNTAGDRAEVVPATENDVQGVQELKYSDFAASPGQYIARAMEGEKFLLLFGQKSKPVGVLQLLADSSVRALTWLERTRF